MPEGVSSNRSPPSAAQGPRNDVMGDIRDSDSTLQVRRGNIQWSKLFKPASTTGFFSGEPWPLAKLGNSSLSSSCPPGIEILGTTSWALACSTPELEPGSLRFMDDVPAPCLHVLHTPGPRRNRSKSEGVSVGKDGRAEGRGKKKSAPDAGGIRY